MKELSIEEKAKAYDELLDKAKQIYNKENDVLIKHIIEGLFPELKESEDEKIRKLLSAYFAKFKPDDMWDADFSCGDIVAWLEKQKAVDILDEEEREFADSVDSYRKEVDAAYQNGYNEGVRATLEKQGEKLPVGFYYVNSEGKKFYSDTFKYGNVILHVEKQGEQKPDKVEPKFKVGDWAVSNLDGKARQISEVHFDEYNSYYVVDGKSVNLEEYDRLHHLWTIQDAKDGDVLAVEPIEGYSSSFVAIYKKQNEEDFDSYCFVGFDGKFCESECGHSTEDIHPATKEQRDTLTKAMADAGYTFDFEKKELKKVEHKYVWSEEDEDILNTIINHFEIDLECTENDDIIRWLKSLRPQNRWKPSDEQIKALETTLYTNISRNDERYSVLSEFVAELKKLKG